MSPCQAASCDASDVLESHGSLTQTGPTACRSDAVRKVVQIAELDGYLMALCSDGSLWVRDRNNPEWDEMTPPPGCRGGA
jgi:hypothetical protein